MENLYARRNFLKNVALVTSGVALLSPTIVQAFNTVECPYEGYNPYSQEKSDLRVSTLFGNHIVVKGKVFDKNNLKELSNATLEVWHMSPNSSKFRHQAKLKVNSSGEFNFITDFPNREQGKFAKVYFKVSTTDRVYFTELSVTKDNAFINEKHFEENKALGDHRFPTNRLENNQQTITFNIAV